MSSVLVVYSGGLDSYTLLNKAMKKFDRIEAITFNYGQKHNKEIEYAKSNCAELNIKHEVVNLDLENILAGSALVGDIDIPEGNYDKEKMKQTIVPNRNMIMISVAASLVIKNDIEYMIKMHESRVQLLNTEVLANYDNNQFDVVLVYQIIGADTPPQQLEFVLLPSR